jgi:hypothetical protein
VNEAEEILALALIFVVHVVGGLMLVWGMVGGDALGWRRPWRRDDGPDAPRDDAPPAPPAAPLPLAGAAPSRVRLRDEVPLRDAYPPAPRRPQHEPAPERVPQRR